MERVVVFNRFKILRRAGEESAFPILIICLMVGNDLDEDIRPALSLGMKAFLLTPCLIDRGGPEVAVPRGGFAELKEFLLKNL